MIQTIRYSLQKSLVSERAAWAAQNAVGAILPTLFVVVPELRFSGSCVALLFYGVSSQAFSIDRSIGGRVFGALLWTGAFFFGGVLAYALTSLAWLARGSGVEGVLAVEVDILNEISTPERSNGTASNGELGADSAVENRDLVAAYFKDGGQLPSTEKISNSSSPLIEELIDFNASTVNSAYYILVMVLHLVASFYMSRPRAMENDFFNKARGTLSHVYMSVITTMAVLMPLMGQELYWTQNIGGMLKGITITMAGAIIGPVAVYVQSSHDNVRRHLAGCMVDTGILLSRVASGGWDYAGKKHTPQDLIKQTVLAEGDLMCCSFEPPWPMLTSQVGADYRVYGRTLLQLQKLIGSVNAISCCLGDGSQARTDEDPLLDIVKQCSVAVVTSLQKMAICLNDMPLKGPCSGNGLSWRPCGEKYWMGFEELLVAGFGSLRLKSDLQGGTCKEIQTILEGDRETKLMTSTLTLLVATESLLEECISLEDWVAKALGITDISDCKGEMESKSYESGIGWLKSLRDCMKSPYLVALLGDLKQATSYSTYVLQIARFWDTNSSIVRGKWANIESIRQLLYRRDVQFYLKFFFAVNGALIAIILVEWLGYGNTPSSITNATSMASWYFNWQPEYFLTATIICFQQTVEISVVKAILRCSMIALGGVLGCVCLKTGGTC
jgi:hypothetical protein